MVLPDFDAVNLESKRLLDAGLETVVFQTPPQSNDHFEASGRFIALHTGHFESMCRHLLGDSAAMEALRGLDADLLFLDVAFPCGQAISELLGKRVVLFSPVDIVDPFWSRFGRLPYSPAVHAALGSGLVHPMTWRERATNALLSPLMFWLGSSVARASAQRIARDFGLPGAGDPRDAFRGSRLLLVNAADGLVGPLLVGGEPKPLPADLAAILEGAGPRGAVYVSFGTTFRPSSCDVVRGLAAALSALNRTVIWGLNPARLPAACPLDVSILPASIHIMEWVPQADLLGHAQIKTFLSHAGVNSIYEAPYRGKPLVCMPLAADQFDGCAKAVKGGWGLQFKKEELSPATAHRLTARLEQASAEGSPLAQRAAVVGAMLKAHSRPALELAADWVEYALALPQDADLSDPAMAMPMWKRYCLDVYAAAAAAVVAVLGSATLVLRAGGRMVWRWLTAGRRSHGKTE
ncbi:hypothetical protein CHLNCDRAFT_140490 [Chlorella variabilis]|uniref:Glycosyltransferase n=1 Tax=Chlorella variabilis TaxID=554065 RepID=E1Z5H5_CHLVA|nr:hypothetical protein CHLNCDRAFT_140490 [Chlorella variabilis]EFN58760.1 hypothetical protein CHLNCDRAFT_140490 [Chlorella variabilis]|eukprot:XP_005850862.1 hypothetical protein CHLNCDRAFT_140490 [Chlorella variabilis]